jgi:hypothetical protein
MMNQLPTSRYTALGFCLASLAMVWLLLISLIYVPHRQAKSVSQTAELSKLSHPKLAKTIHKLHRVAVAKNIVPEDVNTVNMHSFQQEYAYKFTGQVTCGGNACKNAEVKVQIQTDTNPHIIKEASVLPDGTYEVTVLFKEVPHEQIEWRISADSADSTMQEVHGRQILDEDPNVTIDEPVNLL